MLYRLMRWVSWVVLRFWCGYHVEGREHIPPRGPYIVVANHISFLDPPAVGPAFKPQIHFIAKEELFSMPWLGPLIRGLGAIPVNISQPTAVNRRVLKTAIEHLRRGEVIALFPEGGRQLSGRVAPAKLGAAFIAVHARVPVVPVGVIGTDRAMPPGTKRIRRGQAVTVRIGSPIHVSAAAPVGRQQYEDLAQRVTRAIAQLVENK